MMETQLSLVQWRAKGKEMHSLVATPAQLFVNAGASDYHLSTTSPARNAGTSVLAPPNDFDGERRQGAGGFDIGAYKGSAKP